MFVYCFKYIRNGNLLLACYSFLANNWLHKPKTPFLLLKCHVTGWTNFIECEWEILNIWTELLGYTSVFLGHFLILANTNWGF